MDNDTLKKLQLVEEEILHDIDIFCRSNEICYSLTGGSLIGAIRHKGFIPWDDDIDIILTRNDYDKFLALWDNSLFDGKYTLERDGIGGICGRNHTKIRKNNTLFVTNEDSSSNNGHQGIWLDIFAFDKVPVDKKKRKKYMFNAKKRLLFSRNKPYTKGSFLLKIISKLLISLPISIKNRIKNKAEIYIRKYSNLTENFEYVELTSPSLLGKYYPPYIMDDFMDVDFDKERFMVSTYFDTILTIRFGDYMTPPPVDERICIHNPDTIVFDTIQEKEEI